MCHLLCAQYFSSFLSLPAGLSPIFFCNWFIYSSVLLQLPKACLETNIATYLSYNQSCNLVYNLLCVCVSFFLLQTVEPPLMAIFICPIPIQTLKFYPLLSGHNISPRGRRS